MATKISDVNQAIMFGNFSNDELTSIIDAVKFARSRIQKQNIRSMCVGDPVTFTSSKTGMLVKGMVQKIAIKYVTVKTNQGMWKVPANMLQVATA